jgi:hypothetical protein
MDKDRMSRYLPSPSIREILLEVIEGQRPTDNSGPTLQQVSVLEEAQKRLAKKVNSNSEAPNSVHIQRYGAPPLRLSPEMEEALLTQWGELFRTGLLAWGLNLSNPNPPFFHLTDIGKTALANATRDPSNPAGYLRHLDSVATLNPISRSYLLEGLDCYVAGLIKASAVMIGAAAEGIVIELAKHTELKLISLNRTPPKGLSDWKVKTLSEALRSIFETQKNTMESELRESVVANWPGFSYQIRATRNEAGHPTSVEPVTSDRVHAAFLTFPELAKLANKLGEWVTNDLV